jgi:hypothetical protein
MRATPGIEHVALPNNHSSRVIDIDALVINVSEGAILEVEILIAVSVKSAQGRLVVIRLRRFDL